jgi:YD repeat-containing protein
LRPRSARFPFRQKGSAQALFEARFLVGLDQGLLGFVVVIVPPVGLHEHGVGLFETDALGLVANGFDQGADAEVFDGTQGSELNGRLAQIRTTNPGMATISYPYDALGRLGGRIVRDSNGLVVESTTFVWDGNHIARDMSL